MNANTAPAATRSARRAALTGDVRTNAAPRVGDTVHVLHADGGYDTATVEAVGPVYADVRLAYVGNLRLVPLDRVAVVTPA